MEIDTRRQAQQAEAWVNQDPQLEPIDSRLEEKVRFARRPALKTKNQAGAVVKVGRTHLTIAPENGGE